MTITYHSIEYLTLTVEHDGTVYTYERVPEWYVAKVRSYLRRGYEGKAWQLLRRFRVERKGVRI